MPGMYRSVKM